MFNNVIEQLQHLRFGKHGENIAPHKFALLIALAALYEEDSQRRNQFAITEELEREFRRSLLELAPDYQISTVTIESPFYFLKNDGFWFLQVRPGLKEEYERIERSDHARFTKRRLTDLVSFGFLSNEFDEFLRNQANRHMFCAEVRRLFKVASATRLGEWQRQEPSP